MHDLAVWQFTPYPGSELFNQLKHTDRLQKKFGIFSEDYLNSLIYGQFVQSLSWNDRECSA